MSTPGRYTAPKTLRGPQANERTNRGGRHEDREGAKGVPGHRGNVGSGPGTTPGSLNSSPAAGRPRRSHRGHLARQARAGPPPPRPSSGFPPRYAQRKPASTSSRHYSEIRKDRSPFSMASSSFLASIPHAPRGDTWSWGPAAPGFPGSDWAPATAPTGHTTHLLAGAELALGRSPEEGGPGGEEEVLGVLLQAAVAAAHAAGPVARGPPPRGAGGQAGGAAPARPARFPARGPKPPAGRPAAAAAAAQPSRPGPSRRLPASRPGSWRGWGPRNARRPRPLGRGPAPAPPRAPRAPPREAWDAPQAVWALPAQVGVGAM